MKFENLGLAEPLLRAVVAEGYHTATRIQVAAIPPILLGQDLLGCAQTGTGKTAAFALPTLHRLSQAPSRVNGKGRKIRTLVLAPTRELALQICESFRVYGQHTGLKQTAIYGGVSQGSQVRALNGGIDVLVATPGRLLDLMNQGHVDLAHVQILILDEADRMLDMGFIHDLRRIVAKIPRRRQTLLFSATIPAAIRTLAREWLTNPADVHVAPVASTAAQIQQSVFFVEKRQKQSLLTHWLRQTAWARVLLFTRTKHGADKVMRNLIKAGIPADAIHGNKSQSARQRALARFKLPKPLVLVATDVAARGLDVDNISHVVNFELPEDPECYVHRIGRTGRAEACGIAVSFCDRDEREKLQLIQRLTRQTLAVEKLPADLPADVAAGTPSRRGDAGEASASQGRREQRPLGQRRGVPGKRGGTAKSGAIVTSARKKRRREERNLATAN